MEQVRNASYYFFLKSSLFFKKKSYLLNNVIIEYTTPASCVCVCYVITHENIEECIYHLEIQFSLKETMAFEEITECRYG